MVIHIIIIFTHETIDGQAARVHKNILSSLGGEEEETSIGFRSRCGFNAGEKGNTIAVFDCCNHFWERVRFPKIVDCGWGVGNVDS